MRGADDAFVALADLLRADAAPVEVVAPDIETPIPAPVACAGEARDDRLHRARSADEVAAIAERILTERPLRRDRTRAGIVLGTALLGRTVGPPFGKAATVAANVPTPHERVAVSEPFWTGVRALDGPLAFGRGARMGIFGSAGAGKSTLLGDDRGQQQRRCDGRGAGRRARS